MKNFYISLITPVLMLKKVFVGLAFLLIHVILRAQPGALDLTFNPGTGADSTIVTATMQPDGKILIGGDFSTYNGQPARCLARLLPNGTMDTTFNIGSGFNRRIHKIIVLPDGRILAAGDLDNFNGDSVRKLIRLFADGRRDTSFRANYFFGGIKEMLTQPDNKIVIGGSFVLVNGQPIKYLARLDENGFLDTSFHTLGALDGSVECIAQQPDSKLIIAGAFTSYSGINGYRIARIDTNAAIDTTFNPGVGGAGSTVEALSLLPGGKLLLGGQFTFYNGSTVGHIVRTYNDGTIDFAFPQTPGANNPVYALNVLPNGNYIFGGTFSTLSGAPAPKIGVTTPSGIFDAGFNAGIGADDQVWSINTYPQDKLIITGDFKNYNGTSRKRIARLYNCLTPQPDTIYGNSYALCNGTQQTYSINTISGATKYEWTLPQGWTGTSDSTSITTISNGTGGTISVKAFTDSCGYSYPTTRNIATVKPPGVNLCLVTVDTQSMHNIVIWEKPQTELIDSFFIYRETSTNNYSKIAAVPYDSLSEYIDMDTAADPNATSHRYKLSVLDTCGAESDLSDFHNTIHLQNLGSGNFQWTFYQIENALNPVLSFNIYRDNLGNGNFAQIGNVPGSNATFSDVTFNSFQNSVYVIDANWGISCTPTRAVNTTRSNIRHKGTIDIPISGIEETTSEMIQVYPNPAEKFIHLLFSESIRIIKLELFNSIGQLVLSKAEANNNQLNLEGIPQGVYTLLIETNSGRVMKKIVVE